MEEQKFKIVFKGEIVPNANLEEVKKKLAAFSDPGRLDGTFKKCRHWTMPLQDCPNFIIQGGFPCVF